MKAGIPGEQDPGGFSTTVISEDQGEFRILLRMVKALNTCRLPGEDDAQPFSSMRPLAKRGRSSLGTEVCEGCFAFQPRLTVAILQFVAQISIHTITSSRPSLQHLPNRM